MRGLVGGEPVQQGGGVFDLLGVDGDGWGAESVAEGVGVAVEVPVPQQPAGGTVGGLAGSAVDVGDLDQSAGFVSAGFDGLLLESVQVGPGILDGLVAGVVGDDPGKLEVHRVSPPAGTGRSRTRRGSPGRP